MATPGLGRPLPDGRRDARGVARRHRVVRQPPRRQRRLFAGLESLCGWGGDRNLLGIDPSTVSHRPPAARRPRCRGRPGAARGRRTNTDGKKTPEVIARIEALMTHETAGDPVSGLKWTRRTTAKLADELRGLGIHVCPQTVARLLKAMGYSLRVNHKKLAGASHPNRDHLSSSTSPPCASAGPNAPSSASIREKKELVGTFRNPGAKWDRRPNSSTTTTFRSDADGRAVPYGIYDPRANAGTVFVGRTADTPAFAVDCIEKWWRTEGRRSKLRSPTAVAATAATARAWKFNRATSLLQPARLAGEGSPLPAGHVAWNPIEDLPAFLQEGQQRWRTGGCPSTFRVHPWSRRACPRARPGRLAPPCGPRH